MKFEISTFQFAARDFGHGKSNRLLFCRNLSNEPIKDFWHFRFFLECLSPDAGHFLSHLVRKIWPKPGELSNTPTYSTKRIFRKCPDQKHFFANSFTGNVLFFQKQQINSKRSDPLLQLEELM